MQAIRGGLWPPQGHWGRGGIKAPQQPAGPRQFLEEAVLLTCPFCPEGGGASHTPRGRCWMFLSPVGPVAKVLEASWCSGFGPAAMLLGSLHILPSLLSLWRAWQRPQRCGQVACASS